MPEHTVYAVASGKGGVGKTATTVNLGAALAERGFTVVLVDADLGMANLGGYLDVGEEGRTLHEVLAGEADLEDVVYDVGEGLAVVPSGITLNGFANVETAALSDAVGALKDAFDYVLLDIGAGLSHDNVLPLALADAVLLVSTPKPLALQDTAKTREITERLGGAIAGAVLTRAGQLGDLDLESVEDQLGIPVLAVIPEDAAVQEGATANRPVVGFDPDSPAAEGYRGLAGIVEEESLGEAPVVPELPTAEAGTAGAGKGQAAEQVGTAADESGADSAEEEEAAADGAEPAAEGAEPADPAAAGDADEAAADGAEPADPASAGDADEAAAVEQGGEPAEEASPGEGDEATPRETAESATGEGPVDADGAAPTDDGEVEEAPAADAGEPEPPEASEAGAGDEGEREFAPEPAAETTAADIAAAIEEATEGDADTSPDDLDLEADADLRPESGDEGGLRIESAEDRAADRADERAEAAADGELSIEGTEPDEDEEEQSGGILSRLFGG